MAIEPMTEATMIGARDTIIASRSKNRITIHLVRHERQAHFYCKSHHHCTRECRYSIIAVFRTPPIGNHQLTVPFTDASKWLRLFRAAPQERSGQ